MTAGIRHVDWIGIFGIAITILVGWLSLRTTEGGLQVLNEVPFAGGSDRAVVGANYRPFRGAQINLEIHNTGSIGFALSDVRIAIKRSKLTTDKGGFIALRQETLQQLPVADVPVAARLGRVGNVRQ